MRKIDIRINKAQVLGFNVMHADPLPQCSVTIGLFSEQGKKISEYSLATNAWDDRNKFDLPAELIEPIIKIANHLEKVVVAHCQASQNLLPEVANA